MTHVMVTIDTELSAGLHQRGASAEDNFKSSILGKTPHGDFGIAFQMGIYDKFGVKAVFFVDPMPALIYGEERIRDITDLILRRGHSVQLHCHTEWLTWATKSPVQGRTGRNIGDFDYDDQLSILSTGADILKRACGYAPIAFRAGNFGANDDTIRALDTLGFLWDSSVNADDLGRNCRITCDVNQTMPYRAGRVTELPVSGLFDRPGHFRPAQVCAISAWEMRSALRHAGMNQHPVFTTVTHSFEMLSRDRQRPNRTVIARLEALARMTSQTPHLRSAVFADLTPAAVVVQDRPRLPPNIARTLARVAGQAWSTLCYDRKLPSR